MKVLFVGDAVCGSGFARCTHAACDELHSRGHEVKVLGLNYYGDPHDYPYTIMPCWNPPQGGTDYYGNGRLPKIVDSYEPDAVVILNDPWNVAAYMMVLTNKSNRFRLGFNTKTVAWVAVDGSNQQYSKQLNWLDKVVAWTDFGRDELIRAGIESEKLDVVPLGFDEKLFFPSDGSIVRNQSLPENLRDSFILLYVGRNQTRKRLDSLLFNFNTWYRHQTQIDGCPPNACLVFCTNTTGEKDFDLESLVKYLDLKDVVMIVQPPDGAIKNAVENDKLRYLYSAANVFVSCSQAEGWCLPALEAMACGTACALPDSAGFRWAREGAIMIPATTSLCTSPVDASMFTIGSLVDTGPWVATIKGLYESFRTEDKKLITALGQNGLQLSKDLTWKHSGIKFADLLEEVVSG